MNTQSNPLMPPTAILESPSTNQNSSATAEPESVKVASYFQLKYSLEKIIAGLLLIPALPLILVFGVIVRLTSRGPAIYKQKRVGLHGKEFFMLKIRTMVVNAEDAGPQWSPEVDPRVTMIGRFLRFAHLDELPQLFNVLKGEMTIVGPRPERPEFVRLLETQIPNYSDRTEVKPGITGLAQIYLPPDQTIKCVRKKICFDRAYIESATLFVDTQIWLCTLVRILGIRNGRGPRWFGLEKNYRSIIRDCAKIEESNFGMNSLNPVHENENDEVTSAPVSTINGTPIAKSKSAPIVDCAASDSATLRLPK